NEDCLKIKSFANDDEVVLLNEFKSLVINFMTTSYHHFCGHNIKEFDMPYIGRRMLINGIELPPQLQFQNKKPWEMPLLDTMSFWKFGDYKNYTSLKLLAEVLGVPTPKDDIDGSMVADVYYNENNLQRIAIYCQKDVIATVQVWRRLNSKLLIKTEHIEFVK
ncbi:MAG: 3'-5' exonuclease, partial [Paludibacter sp.]